MNIHKFDFESWTQDRLLEEENLKYLHHCLSEVAINEGFLHRPNYNKEYVINKGIPNLVLNDDEV